MDLEVPCAATDTAGDRLDTLSEEDRGRVARRNLPKWRGQVDHRMTDLSAIIGDLIATGKEGDYWDFKCEPHAKTGDLIKDIICLANTPRHTGDRYIIYGVDNTGSVVGLQPATPRTQADIVNTLSKLNYTYW